MVLIKVAHVQLHPVNNEISPVLYQSARAQSGLVTKAKHG